MHKRSDVILHVAFDSSYLLAYNSRSRIGGHYLFGSEAYPKTSIGNQFVFYNTPIQVKASMLKHAMSAASESEITEAFVNAN